MSEIESTLLRLKEAKTLRDLFSLPLPLKIKEIEDPDLLHEKWPEGRVDFFLKKSNGAIETQYLPAVVKDFAQAVAEVELHFESTALSIDGRTGESPAAIDFHLESRRQPFQRHYICCTESPTLIVPHAEILRILEKSRFNERLDVEISQKSLQRASKKGFPLLNAKTEEARLIYQEFLDQAKPISQNEIWMMSGLTLHAAPEHQPNSRRFLHAASI